ncbi:MAG: hypothetical protein KVP17_002110, partial [Porospora cf. gigantea B]|uniref:uncharacterized protein n=1 Tax=Porospora cf. gigantea B TaxID=2853592 RepID=UPI003571DCF1
AAPEKRIRFQFDPSSEQLTPTTPETQHEAEAAPKNLRFAVEAKSSSSHFHYNSRNPSGASSFVTPFRRHVLPSRWQLPESQSRVKSGPVKRLRRTVRRKWNSEKLVLQHGLLISMAQESPPLIQVSFSLMSLSLVGMWKKRPLCFEVHYSIPTKKGHKTKTRVVVFMVESASECQKWILEIQKHQRLGVLDSQNEEFVSMAAAEMKVSELHDALRNGGLFAVVSRTVNLLDCHMTISLRDAFHILRLHCSNKKRQQESASLAGQLKVALVRTETAEHTAKTAELAAHLKTRFQRFAIHVERMELRLLRAGWVTLLRNMLRTQSRRLMAGTKAVVDGLVETQLAIVASRTVQGRRKHLKYVIDRAYLRQVGDAFHLIRAYGALAARGRNKAKLQCMDIMLRKRELKQRLIAANTVAKWNLEANRRRQEDTVMLRLISRATPCRAALRRWCLAAIRLSEVDRRVVQSLDNVAERVRNRLTHSALLCMSSHSQSRAKDVALQISHNLVKVNSRMVEHFDGVPMERACYLMDLWVRNRYYTLRQCGLAAFRNNLQTKRFVERAVWPGLQIVERLARRRKQQAFIHVMKTAFHKSLCSASQVQGTSQLVIGLEAVFKHRKMEVLMQLTRKNAYERYQHNLHFEAMGRLNVFQLFVYRFDTWLTRCEHARMQSALGALSSRVRFYKMADQLYNVKVIDRLTSLLSQNRTSVLLKAMGRLQEHRVKSQMHEVLGAKAHLESELRVAKGDLLAIGMPLESMASSALASEISNELREVGVSYLPTRKVLPHALTLSRREGQVTARKPIEGNPRLISRWRQSKLKKLPQRIIRLRCQRQILTMPAAWRVGTHRRLYSRMVEFLLTEMRDTVRLEVEETLKDIGLGTLWNFDTMCPTIPEDSCFDFEDESIEDLWDFDEFKKQLQLGSSVSSPLSDFDLSSMQLGKIVA